jgi:hypothetical protein
MPGYVYRRAQTKGLLGGNRTWSIVWAVLFGLRILRRLTKDEPKVVYSEKLEPGQAIIIRHGDRPVRVLGGEQA